MSSDPASRDADERELAEFWRRLVAAIDAATEQDQADPASSGLSHDEIETIVAKVDPGREGHPASGAVRPRFLRRARAVAVLAVLAAAAATTIVMLRFRELGYRAAVVAALDDGQTVVNRRTALARVYRLVEHGIEALQAQLDRGAARRALARRSLDALVRLLDTPGSSQEPRPPSLEGPALLDLVAALDAEDDPDFARAFAALGDELLIGARALRSLRGEHAPSDVASYAGIFVEKLSARLAGR